MPNPRQNNSSRNASASKPSNDGQQMHFVENTSARPVQDFIDDFVAPYEGAKFLDFKVLEGQSKLDATKTRVSFLSVCMPQMRVNPATKSIELNEKVDESGEVISAAPMLDVKINASKDANKIIIENKKAGRSPIEGINVSAFYDTNEKTGEETGLVGFLLTESVGESVSLDALGLRINR